MPDVSISQPDLALVLGPEDTAIPIGAAPSRRGRRSRGPDTLYVVVHRTRGLWTHVYRLTQTHEPGHLWVFLERVFEGDCTDEACSWARELTVE